MSPPTYPLGRSDMHITRLGFGSWAAGGGGWAFGWGPQDDEASLAAMRHAIEAGMTWIVEDAWAAMTKLIEEGKVRPPASR